jgi:hypothetical protein
VEAQLLLDRGDITKLSIVDLRAKNPVMAQQNIVDDENTDFSGLASSLLPPSGAFFSGWTPQQWQNLTPSYNAQDSQLFQHHFTNPYESSSFQNDSPESSTAYHPYDPNEYRASDRPLTSGEASAPASAEPLDSAQVQFYHVCVASYHGTLLTQKTGHQ